MKKLFITPFALIAMQLSAQQTITGTSGIGFTSTINIASAATASNVPLTTGANVTWNCANLSTTLPPAILTIGSPSGKPYASDYPTSNYHMNVTINSSVVANEFFIHNNDSLVKLGGHVSGSPYEIYNNPQIDMKFPFSYNDILVNTYSKTSYNANGSVSSTQTGSVTLSYEGYGTLILPAGTFTNVALLKRIRTNSIGPTTTSYAWVTYPSGDKLMDYDNNGSIKVNYISGIVTNIPFLPEENEFTVFPSHSNGTIFIHGMKTIGTVNIYDYTGALIQSETGKTEIRIDAHQGVYLVEIMSADSSVRKVKRIVLN